MKGCYPAHGHKRKSDFSLGFYLIVLAAYGPTELATQNPAVTKTHGTNTAINSGNYKISLQRAAFFREKSWSNTMKAAHEPTSIKITLRQNP